MSLPVLSVLTLLPLAGGIIVLLLGRPAARATALAFATASVAFILFLWSRFKPAAAGMQFEELHPWEPAIGFGYHLGLDGLGLLMLAVSSIVVLMSVAASWSNAKQGSAAARTAGAGRQGPGFPLAPGGRRHSFAGRLRR